MTAIATDPTLAQIPPLAEHHSAALLRSRTAAQGSERDCFGEAAEHIRAPLPWVAPGPSRHFDSRHLFVANGDIADNAGTGVELVGRK
jgi:hypothetical protein